MNQGLLYLLLIKPGLNLWAAPHHWLGTEGSKGRGDTDGEKGEVGWKAAELPKSLPILRHVARPPSQLWQAHWQLGDKNRKFTEYVFKNTALFIPFLLDIYLSHWSAVVVYFASASVPVLDLDNTLCLVFVFWLRLGEPSNYCLAGFRQRDTPPILPENNQEQTQLLVFFSQNLAIFGPLSAQFGSFWAWSNVKTPLLGLLSEISLGQSGRLFIKGEGGGAKSAKQFLTSSHNDICNITRTTDAIVFTLFSNFLLIQILTWLHIGFCGIELSWIYLKISFKDQRKLKVWKISKLLSYKCFLLFCVSSLECLLPDEPASEGPIHFCNRSKILHQQNFEHFKIYPKKCVSPNILLSNLRKNSVFLVLLLYYSDYHSLCEILPGSRFLHQCC